MTAMLWSPSIAARPLRAEEPAGKHVLLLYSHESANYADFDGPLRSSLTGNLDYPVDFYTEYLDLIRFPTSSHAQQIADYLRVKYNDRRIDLVVAVSPLAFDFLLARGDELFGGLPIVFASINIARFQEMTLPPNVTGVAVQRDFKDTLTLALRVHPTRCGWSSRPARPRSRKPGWPRSGNRSRSSKTASRSPT